MHQPNIVALVPLRGGSKRIPGKNTKPIAGKPLAYWVCSAAKNSRHIKAVYVSTEDEDIARTVQSFGLDVRIVKRPPSLAKDDSTTDDVICHFMSLVDFDVVATIQATSPLLSPADLDCAIEQFQANGSDSLVSGVPVKRFFWTRSGEPLNYDPFRRPFTQNFAGSIMENGAFYLTTRSVLEAQRNRLGGKIAIYEMPAETATEIDDTADWKEVELRLNQKAQHLSEKAKQLKIILSDFDGVWTDNKVYTLDNNNEAVCCSKSDSLALDMFRTRFDLPMVVVTKESNPVVRRRCDKLQLPVFQCVTNKCAVIEQELMERGVSWKEACYIGNDLNDLECMNKAHLTFCPSDAAFEIKCKSDYILGQPGGNGAIREMLGLLSKEL